MGKKQIIWLMLALLSLGTVVSCSESDDDPTAEEFSDWQARNDAFFASLQDSLSRDASRWKKFKSFTKNEKTAGDNTEYVYVKVIDGESYSEGCPIYTDSVRVAYRGRLLPSTTYIDGYVFDETYAGSYNFDTTSVLDAPVNSFVDGFATALLHMRKGERWRVYIPYQLGYGTGGSTSIPGCSVLVFDLVLIDYVTAEDSFYPWTSRRMLK